jgi:ribonuclease HI
MINCNSIFNDKTLNIFTDASVYKTKNETIGSPGYVAVIGENIVDQKSIILRESTNNESELYAINMAIQYALYNRDKVEVINIFSDSQFAVYGLREWIFSWLNNIRNDRIYNSSGNQVANQALFMSIIYAILSNDLKISLYHNRGHFKNSQVKEFINLFTKHNFLNDYIDYQTAYKIMYFNNIVDNNTRTLLHNTEVFPNKLEIPDYMARNDLDINHYKELLNII